MECATRAVLLAACFCLAAGCGDEDGGGVPDAATSAPGPGSGGSGGGGVASGLTCDEFCSASFRRVCAPVETEPFEDSETWRDCSVNCRAHRLNETWPDDVRLCLAVMPDNCSEAQDVWFRMLQEGRRVGHGEFSAADIEGC